MAKDRRDKFLSVPPYVCLENVFPRLNDIYFGNVIRIGNACNSKRRPNDEPKLMAIILGTLT